MPYKFSLLAAGLLLGILTALYLNKWPPPEALLLQLLVSLSLVKRQHLFIGTAVFGYCWLILFLAWRMDNAPSTTQPSSYNSLISAKHPHG